MIRKKKLVRGKSSATPSLPPMPGPWALGFSALALALAVGASLSVRQTPLFGLMLFIAAGLALAGAAWMRPEWGQGLELPRRSQPFQRWEAVFLLAYAAAYGLLRFHGLGDLPPGAHGHEGEMAARLLRLADEPYVGHVQDGDILWPTLSFYHGLAGIKFLGYSSAALRLPAAILAFCSLFVFYFLARRISSPGPAAIASVLYGADILHQGMGRNLFPGAVLFLAAPLALYFLQLGLGSKRLWPFIAAGAGGALSLHGFVPGRTLWALFAFWMAWIWLIRRDRAAQPRQWAAFWAAFLLVASPVIWWAVGHWDNYWAYVGGHNPHGGGGPFGYVKGLFAELPTYARAFHVVGDNATADTIAGRPFLDPLSGGLMALGLFFCLARIWQPLPIFIFGLFFLGVLPAMLGGGFSHPTARRVIMALPAAYLFAAIALERLRLGFGLQGRKTLAWGLGIALLGASVFIAQKQTRDYLAFLMTPKVKGGFHYSIYLAAKEIRARPQHSISVGVSLVGPVTSGMLMPRERTARVMRSVEEFFNLPRGQDHLLLLSGYYEASEGLLRRAFPNAVITKHVEAAKEDNNYADPYNPYLYLMVVDVPKADIDALYGMQELQPGGAWANVGAFDGGFAESRRGKRLRLRATAIGDVKASKLRFELAWPGWSLRVNGRPQPLNRELNLEGGAHEVELEGPVAANAAGPLPLRVSDGNTGDLRSAGRLLALSPGGVLSTFYDGEATWGGKVAFQRRELAPLRRYYDYTELTLPYCVRFEGTYTPAESGRFEFHPGPWVKPGGRVRIDGRLVFDSVNRRETPLSEAVEFKAGKAVKLQFDYQIDPTVAERRTQVLSMRPVGGEWSFLPGDAVVPR